MKKAGMKQRLRDKGDFGLLKDKKKRQQYPQMVSHSHKVHAKYWKDIFTPNFLNIVKKTQSLTARKKKEMQFLKQEQTEIGSFQEEKNRVVKDIK